MDAFGQLEVVDQLVLVESKSISDLNMAVADVVHLLVSCDEMDAFDQLEGVDQLVLVESKSISDLPHRKSSSEALENDLQRSRTRALVRECSMLMLNLQLQQLAYRTQDNLKSCPEAVSGLGVLRCLKTSEGNSLTKRVLGFGNAAKSN